MSNKESRAFKLGRDTRTGEFVSVEKARDGNPERYVIEHIPKAGYGDTKEKNK